jgi:hypothetical protein
METRHRTDENAIRESTVATVPSNHMGHCRPHSNIMVVD